MPGLGDSTEEQEAWYRSRLAELEEAVRALGAEPWPACEPPSLPEHLIVPWRNSDGPPLGPGLDLGADPTHKVGDGVGELIRYLVSRKR